MATTTNYGWTTPDDTALVKDGAAAIRTLGSSVDTTTKALNPSTTLGDIEYRSSTANTNTRLGIGSTGNVLTVAGGVPSWAAPSSAPTFQNVYDSSERTTTSTSFVALGSSSAVTITTGTKALVLMGGQIRYYGGAITFDVSGSTSSTGDDTRALIQETSGIEQVTRHFVITGLTAGSNTFTLKYRSTSGSNVQFARTNITVIDLGS